MSELPHGVPGLDFGRVVILPGDGGFTEIEVAPQETKAPAEIKGVKDRPVAKPGTSVVLTPLPCGEGKGVTTGPAMRSEGAASTGVGNDFGDPPVDLAREGYRLKTGTGTDIDTETA